MTVEDEGYSDSLLAGELRRLDRELRWAPRDHSREVRRAEARLAAAKEYLRAAETSTAEATWKTHRYRFVPALGVWWADQLKQRQERERAAKAQVRWREEQLRRAQARDKRRQEWLELHQPELTRRQELRAEWQRRAEQIGRRRLEEARRRGQQVGSTRAEEEAWVRRQGEAELRRRIEAERAGEREAASWRR